MMMKKLAIASAIALMSMNAAYAQAVPILPLDQEASNSVGLMTQLTASLGSLMNSPVNVDITALGGAVNVAKINGSIDISGTNVTLAGVTGALTGLSTTVIGAMNSSTLDIAKSTLSISDKTASVLNIGGLAPQGNGPKIDTQGFGPGQLGQLATTGTTIIDGTVNATQFNLTGLTSSTDTLASSLDDKLQKMNVMQMAVNMAPLLANVTISATVNPNAWFLNPDNGSVKLSGLQVATTTIGAMNSSITRLGAKLSN